MDTPPASWSYERLLALAPDASTLDQARRLFFARGWHVLEGNGDWLWGEYETKYGDVMQAAVRLEPPLFRCSCKSRRRPCKHSLALILLFLNRPEGWQVRNEAPDWVHALLGQPDTTAKVPAKTNPLQQEKRLELMDQGVEELDKWLQNVARQGLATLAAAPEEWESIAARLVDSKLGSLARRIRQCQALLPQDDWVDTVAGELGLLYLFVRAWQRKSTLLPDQKRELLQVAGWNLRKEQLGNQPGVKDNWLVLGVSSGTDEKLTYRRTWLRGEKTAQFALLLDFVFGNQSFEDQWVTGSVLSGTLVFYPGQPALRAAFRQYHASREPYDGLAGHPDLAAFTTAYAQALALSPWLLAFPALLERVTPVYHQLTATFTLVDQQLRQLPLENNTKAWQLLAASGGQPLTIFGEYDGRMVAPIALLDGGRVVGL
ncbi:MAG: hypothetical protein DA408_18590 [Bacteroidetes bacterium]|nr:MAG: hypothetical protein DA408_18590 [Bacteroidota bacterium]